MGRRPKKHGRKCGNEACGKEIDGESSPRHVGAVVTRSGSKFVCSTDCFLEVMKRDDVCTLGDLDEQAAMQAVLDAELHLARVRAERRTARRVVGRLQAQMIESAIEDLDDVERESKDDEQSP
jgi:hypothetical protein